MDEIPPQNSYTNFRIRSLAPKLKKLKICFIPQM